MHGDVWHRVQGMGTSPGPRRPVDDEARLLVARGARHLIARSTPPVTLLASRCLPTTPRAGCCPPWSPPQDRRAVSRAPRPPGVPRHRLRRSWSPQRPAVPFLASRRPNGPQRTGCGAPGALHPPRPHVRTMAASPRVPPTGPSCWCVRQRWRGSRWLGPPQASELRQPRCWPFHSTRAADSCSISPWMATVGPSFAVPRLPLRCCVCRRAAAVVRACDAPSGQHTEPLAPFTGPNTRAAPGGFHRARNVGRGQRRVCKTALKASMIAWLSSADQLL